MIFAQSSVLSTGNYSLGGEIIPRPLEFLGFPAMTCPDLLKNFKTPPTGYGEVPFLWWTGGDTLTKERLLWQLDQFEGAAIQGLNVSYNHTHRLADPGLNKANDIISFGVPEPSYPAFMSEEWWKLWNWFSEECGRRGMGLGLDDYVVGWPGAGFWTDRVEKDLSGLNYQGRLNMLKKSVFSSPEGVKMVVPETVLTAVAYPQSDGGYNFSAGIDLKEMIGDSVLHWSVPDDRTWDIIIISTEQGYMIHPQHGNTLLQAYYDRFENSLSEEGKKGMNFFFQDELHVPVDRAVWSEDFIEVFKKRKGYDICEYLPALYFDIGDKTPKIRLDYYDVMVELAEKRYFKPIFEWHWRRGKIFGCDNWGRGLNPVAYGDYFRATRWFSAPGNDAPNPASGYSFIQTKVSSSIAHLYKRPRVWLEAFHSLGWNARLSQINFSSYKHYQFGANLLCLHGLYYTTHGGWWEWAPPDFHFRMPYWPHVKEWLNASERLSYLCSQGKHVCDVALLYPVAPLQAENGGTEQVAFKTAEFLFKGGIDFDFIDFQSVNRSEIVKKKLQVSDESYQALILADMTAIHYSTLQKALKFFENGGVVIGIGKLPVASDREGANDPETDRILKRIFNCTAREAALADSPTINKKEGVGLYFPSADGRIVEIISNYIERDFIPEGGKGTVMHREIGDKDFFMVMDVDKNTLCHFKAQGKALLLDAERGDFRELPIVEKTNQKVSLKVPGGKNEANLILFVPGNPVKEKLQTMSRLTEEREIKGKWESEFLPTLDNQWGDFRLPATPDTLGVEGRLFQYVMSDKPFKNRIAVKANTKSTRISYSYGPGFWMIRTTDSLGEKILDEIISERETIEGEGKIYTWKPYDYSLRDGVEGNPGSQGYHGLKAKVSDNFLLLDKAGSYFFKTYINSIHNRDVDINISGFKPEAIYVNGNEVTGSFLELKQGNNSLILYYKAVKPGILQNTGHIIDKRTRSAVVLSEKGVSFSEKYPLSMKWYGQDGVLDYDIFQGKKKYGYYTVATPPGMKKVDCLVYGDLRAGMKGEMLRVEKWAGDNNKGLNKYTIYAGKNTGSEGRMWIEIEHIPGYYSGRAFPEPLKFYCGKGEINTGDWSEYESLKTYSGGLWYRKNIRLKKDEIGENIFLDLGKVVSSAEVYINGKKAGVCLKDPFRLNISEYVKSGDNYFEVLVYSTLANHYYTIPTPEKYKSSFDAGLIGPVKILY